MAIPHLTLLSQDDQRRIHLESLQLLADVGLQILEPEALEILSSFGAKVEGAHQRVRLPADLVTDAVAKAPHAFTLYGRDPGQALPLRQGEVYFTTNGYAIHLYDPATGSRRVIQQDDLAYVTQLADSMDQVDFYSVMATPADAPPETNDRYQWAIALANTTKPIWNTAYGRDGVLDAVAMGAAVRGSRAALRDKPLFTLDLTTLSPMKLDARQASTMIEGARQGLPIGISPGPIAGATGPVTLAGTIVQANAELLGAITLVQLVQAGTPVVFTQYTRSLDMATGGVTMGGPEFALCRIATAEMARFYDLPSRGGGLNADGKACDAQAGAEKMITALSAALAGLTIVAGAGFVDFINTIRPEQLMIDNEIISQIRRYLRGITLDDRSLALAVIGEVGPAGNFLAHDHTAANFRSEFWFPRLWDRKPWSVWESEGGKDVARRAAERLQSWQPKVAPLPEDVQRALWDVVAEADRKHARAR